jgi:prepilin-type N-terminal cleavage/methylation domain-containing protein
MTLIELMVGLVIMALIAGAGYGAVSTITDHRDSADTMLATRQREAALRSSIRGWLVGVHLPAGERGFALQGTDAVWQKLPDDELSFLTRAPTPLGGGEAIVRLYVDRDPRTPERGLTAEFRPVESPAAVLRLELDQRVTGLDVRYLSGVLLGADREARSWRWYPSWISTAALPAAARVTLSGAAGPDSLPSLLVLPMLVAFGGGR